ncbi:MAG: four helix bundle protein [Candidatus Eisenbacteria sp.]|nr:four helix bundle protein [Candidatus Eisenbacteria bacterium]
MPFILENLNVYQKAVAFADRISGLTESFPKGKDYLADQLNRASLSIPANIAEGNGRFLPKDRRNFFVIARGSAQECLSLLEVAKRRNLITEEEHAELVEDLEIIVKMISGLIRRENEKK